MNVVCGNDIVEVSRIKSAIENVGDKFLNRVFTEQEIKYCESKNVHKYQSYAARFAVKEAGFKAFGGLLNQDVCNWKMYETYNLQNGKPKLIIHNEQNIIKNIDVSISHCDEYAIANVIGIVE